MSKTEVVFRKEVVTELSVVSDGIRGSVPGDCLRIRAMRLYNRGICGSLRDRAGGSAFCGGAKRLD